MILGSVEAARLLVMDSWLLVVVDFLALREPRKHQGTSPLRSNERVVDWAAVVFGISLPRSRASDRYGQAHAKLLPMSVALGIKESLTRNKSKSTCA